MERTAFGTRKAGFDFPQEFAADRPARHAHGTRDDLDILFARFDIGFFERLRSVAFGGGDEDATHLYPGGAERHDAVDILAGIESSRRNHRYRVGVLCGKTVRSGHHLRDQALEREIVVFDLGIFISEVSPGFRPFDDDRVGQVVVVGFPLLADDMCGARRRDDRHELGRAFLPEVRGQVERQSCAGEDDVGFFLYGCAYHVGEVA